VHFEKHVWNPVESLVDRRLLSSVFSIRFMLQLDMLEPLNGGGGRFIILKDISHVLYCVYTAYLWLTYIQAPPISRMYRQLDQPQPVFITGVQGWLKAVERQWSAPILVAQSQPECG